MVMVMVMMMVLLLPPSLWIISCIHNTVSLFNNGGNGHEDEHDCSENGGLDEPDDDELELEQDADEVEKTWRCSRDMNTSLSSYLRRIYVLVCKMAVFSCKTAVWYCMITVWYCKMAVLCCKTTVLYCKITVFYCKTAVWYCKITVLYSKMPLFGCKTAVLY